MKKKILILSLVLVLAISTLVLTGCVVGTGDMQDHSVTVEGNFDAIRASHIAVVIFNYSEEHSVRVVAQSNVFNALRISNRSGTLRIRARNNVSITTGAQNLPRIYVTAPSMNSLRLSGSARAENWDTIEGQEFDIRTSGSSRAALDFYSPRNLSITSSGSSVLEVNSNSIDNAEITASGSSRLTVGGDFNRIGITASGSSNLTFEGDATAITTNTSGSSVIAARDLNTITVTISSSGSSRTNITVSNIISGSASGSSRVVFYGGATNTVSTSGSATVTAG